MIAAQRAEVVLGRDQPRGPPGGRRAKDDLQPPGLGRVQGIEQPDIARALVDDPAAVGARVAGVETVVVGMPPQVTAVHRARIHVAGALVVRQERQPAAGQHGAGELAGQPGEDPGERARRIAGRGGGRGRGQPQPPRRSAPVTLPGRRIARHPAVQQGDRGVLDGQVSHRAERQPPGAGHPGGGRGVASRPVASRAASRSAARPAGGGRVTGRVAAVLRGGHRVCPGEVTEWLAGCGYRQHCPVRGPAADPGLGVTPVGQPALVPAIHSGQVHLRRAITPAGPGDHRAVPGNAGVAGRRLVGRDPPGTAAVGWPEPDVILGNEGDEIVVKMREAEVSGRSHRLILGRSARRGN